MKRIISAAVAAIMSLSCMSMAFAEENTVTIYVSPQGSDSNPGTIEAPLKTFDMARKTVQKYIDSGSKIDVIFRGGEYRLDSTVNFTGSDSGKKDSPITYKAYDGEKVEFKGSVTLDISKAKQVTDEKILSRLYDDVKNKVVEIDLTEQGIDLSKLKKYQHHGTEHPLQGGEVNLLVQNGNVQTVSEWPNGFGNYTTWDYAESGDILHYTDTEPNRWKDAKYTWIGGYNAYDFQYARRTVTGIDTENSTISCYSGSTKFTSSQSRRWKIYNLLEEIDVPGEYYMDFDTNSLYWYPEQSLTDSVIELGVLSSFLNIQYAENITFENLCFTHCQGTGITMKQVKNVDFVGCEISNVGQRGMYIYSDLKAETDKDYWQRNMLDGSYDCDILNCKFDNTGHSAIYMNGGNVDTLKKSNNRIENNVITRSAQLAKNFPAIYLEGCGITVSHNNISNCPFHAMNIWGNDHVITYNEIYDVIQESDDCGAIYAGRNTLQRGTEIAYNYIHDIMPTRELVYNFQGGVYLDDSTGGFYIHHNIVANARIDFIVNGGVDIVYENNTSVNINKYHYRLINGGIAENHNAAGGYWRGYIADEELYYSHYPHLKELIEMGKTTTKDPRMAKFTKVTGNLGVNYNEYSIGTNTLEYGTVKNNLQLSECNDFVDPENGDYRIKKDSETYKKIPGLLSEDFDLSQIGVQYDYEVGGEDSKFLQTYPKNGQQGINSSKINFVWQNANGANKYRLVIATDPNLENIVYDNTDYYNKTTVEGLKSNTVYYWKVYAQNISNDYPNEWESSSPVFSFATSIYETLDVSHLNEVSAKTKQTLEKLDTGEEPGQYPTEIKEKVSTLVSLAQTMVNARLGMLKQKNIDQMANILANSFNSIGQTNRGYVDLSKYFMNAGNWTKPVQVNEDSVTVSKEITGTNNVGISGLNHMAGSAIYSFDAKLTVPAGYVIFGINKDNSIAPYAAANNGYSFLFKPNLLELHVTNGTSQVIVATVEHNFANDGNFHRIQYGYVNTDIGNIVMLYVDGEKVIEYLDVINQAVKVRGGFMMHFSGTAGITAELRKTENTGTKEELNEILYDALYRSAKEIINKYETQVTVIQENGKKIFTPDGVYNTAETSMSGGVIMIPFETISKVFGVQTSQNGDILTINDGTRNITFKIGEDAYTVDGVKTEIAKGADISGETPRVPAEALLDAMGKPHLYSSEQGLLIVGNIIYMNNLNAMNKTRLLMNLMEEIPNKEDYIFSEHE